MLAKRNPGGRPNQEFVAQLAVVLTVLACIWAPRAANGADEEVMVTAAYEVSHGMLQVRYETNQAASEDLAQLYGDAHLAGVFTRHILQEINDSLASLNPLAKWKAPADGSPVSAQTLIIAEKLSQATNFNGSLKDWLETFLIDKREAGKFFYWHPTRPPKLGDDYESESEKVLDGLGEVMRDSTLSLIARIRSDEVNATDYRDGKLKIWFKPATPVTNVTIVGMDWPEALKDFKPAGYDDQKDLFESELKRSIASGGLAMAWNDDLEVQRMMTVLRARGMWGGIAQAGPLTHPGAVYWLTFADEEDESDARVHLPHLSHIIFQGAADTNPVIQAVTKELLSKEDYQVVCDSIRENTNNGKNCFLKGVISSRNPEITQGRFVDLFALASYRARISGEVGWVTNKDCITVTNRAGISYPPVPVKQDWLEPRLNRIRNMGWIASAVPTLSDENRLVDNGNRRRRELLHGGMDIWISPPRPKSTNDPAKPSAPATNNLTFKDWLTHTVHYRVEAGARWEDGQPVDWITRFSAAHTETFGSLDTEIRFQNQLSAKIDWQPPKTEGKALPSFISAFTDTGAKRKVDGQDIEIERKGARIGKQLRFDDLNWNPVLNGAVEFADLQDDAGYVSSADEVRAPFAFSLYSEPNIWDAREHWHIRLSATPSVRWHSDTDFYAILGASGQVRVPRGAWDFVTKIDVKCALGSTPPDALPYLGGSEGVRGVRPYGVPAEECIVSRNELWWQIPLIGRSVGSDQHWYAQAYENLRIAGFVDVGWASGIHEPGPTSPWFVSPGVGLRLILMRNTYVSFDYAYGICRPADLGGHRFSLGITTTQF